MTGLKDPILSIGKKFITIGVWMTGLKDPMLYTAKKNALINTAIYFVTKTIASA